MRELAELARLRADAPAAPTNRAYSRLMQAIGAEAGIALETSRRPDPHRRGWRLAALSGAAALAVAAAVAVPLLADGHRTAAPATAGQGGAGAGIQLAAWTVTKLPASAVSAAGLPAGVVAVTISRDEDPAGLQAALAADGIPAFVTFLDGQAGKPDSATPPPRACQNTGLSDAANRELSERIYLDAMKRIPSTYDLPSGGVQMFVIPSAIPRGIGLYLGVVFDPGGGDSRLQGLIKAGPGCAGG